MITIGKTTRLNINDFWMAYTNRMILQLMMEGIQLEGFLESAFIKPPFICEGIYAFSRLDSKYSINIIMKPYEGNDQNQRFDTLVMEVVIVFYHPDEVGGGVILYDGKSTPVAIQSKNKKVTHAFTILPNIGHSEACANETVILVRNLFKEVEELKANENTN